MTERFFLNQIPADELVTERRRVLALLADLVPGDQIFEVGSTAVEGVIGKQDLDFLIRVPAADFERVRQLLDEALERNLHQLSNAVYQGYLVESPQDVAVQLTVADGVHDNFLAFLDLLRNDAELRIRYNELKRRYHGQSMDDYRVAKRAFIEQALGSG